MKIVILCDGRTPSDRVLRNHAESADLFIAADGGANHALQTGLQPDIVTGDMDSFIPDEGYRGRVIRNLDQETNDLEKALDVAIRESDGSYKQILVFGAAGKRLDHTLKNLSVLTKYDDGRCRIRFIDLYGEILLLPRKFRRSFTIGTPISLFPLSGRVDGITTLGLKYPLKNESLENGVRDGTSNEAVKETVEISHKKGDLLLFIVNNLQEL